MNKSTYRYSIIILLLALSSISIADTIFLPASSGRDNWVIPIGSNVPIVYGGKKHNLENANIEGEDISDARKYELELRDFLQFSVDEHILNPDYDLKKDNNSFHCSNCLGRSGIYIPIHKIHKVSFPKEMTAEIYFHGNEKPFHAYRTSIVVKGDEDMGAFGKGKLSAYIGHNGGDEIIFSNRLPSAEIQKKSDLSCMVTMIGGRKLSLSDCRPSELNLNHNGTFFFLSTKKISRIDSTDQPNVFLIELVTGEKRELILVGTTSHGVCGKGEEWYEEVSWRDIETVTFK